MKAKTLETVEVECVECSEVFYTSDYVLTDRCGKEVTEEPEKINGCIKNKFTYRYRSKCPSCGAVSNNFIYVPF